MVRIQATSDYDRLDALIRELVDQHGLHLDVICWTRKTYNIYRMNGKRDPATLLARVESFATTNGEITVFDDTAISFAEKLGTALEEQFGVGEAVVVKQPPPT